MMEYDELELEKLGEEKIALFAVVSDSDPTFNFISAMMYSQMFNVLCNRALTVYHGRLPVHVTCLFDEFANQKIPELGAFGQRYPLPEYLGTYRPPDIQPA